MASCSGVNRFFDGNVAAFGSLTVAAKGRGMRACFSCTGAATGKVISGGGLRGGGLGLRRATDLFGGGLGLSNVTALVARAIGGSPTANNCCLGPLIDLCDFPHNMSVDACERGFRA